MRPHLDGAHGGVERGEAAVEGAEDGDDGVRDLLALLQRLPQQRGALREALHLPRPLLGTPDGFEERRVMDLEEERGISLRRFG